MVYLTCYLVTFAACILGTICGMGGGIIIKKMTPIRTANYTRAHRTAIGHSVTVHYIAALQI